MFFRPQLIVSACLSHHHLVIYLLNTVIAKGINIQILLKNINTTNEKIIQQTLKFYFNWNKNKRKKNSFCSSSSPLLVVFACLSHHSSTYTFTYMCVSYHISTSANKDFPCSLNLWRPYEYNNQFTHYHSEKSAL